MKKRKYHGVRIAVTKIRTIAGNTKGVYYQVAYNVPKDEVITSWHASFGYNEWDEWKTGDIITIGYFDQVVTMKELKKLIDKAVDENE